MSATEPTFTVGFKQLSPDARKAGVAFVETQREGVSGRELRTLLRSAATTAPQVAYPLTPELRITAPSGRYMIQLKEGRLHFVSWSSATSRGGNPTADQIFDIISGAEVVDDTTPVAAGGPAAEGGSSNVGRWIVGGLLVVAIVGINFYSVWNYRKPPGNLLPPFSLKEPERAKRLIETVAGAYETGSASGDRRLQINRDGTVVWIKFGANRATAERNEFTAQGAETNGQDALFTSRKSLIEVKETTVIKLFGDTYVRVPN